MRSLIFEPVQRSEDGCDMRRFRSFNHSTSNMDMDILNGFRESG